MADKALQVADERDRRRNVGLLNTEEEPAEVPRGDRNNDKAREGSVGELLQVVNKCSTKNGAVIYTNSDYKKIKSLLIKLSAAEKEWKKEKENLVDKTSELESLNRNLQAKIQEKRKYISTSRKGEQKEDVKTIIQVQVRTSLFRVRKFANDGPEAMAATGLVYDNIKDDLRLTVERDDFCEIYHPYVQTCLSDRRQYVQTRTGEAASSE